MKWTLVLFLGLTQAQISRAQFLPIRTNIQINLEINDLVRTLTELSQGEISYEPINNDDPLLNPLYPQKVNMRLNGRFNQSFFYHLKIINALGYKDDRATLLYLLVPGNEGLVQMLSEDIGFSGIRANKNPPQSGSNSYIWDYNGYTITLSPNTNFFNEAEPARFYYEVTISNNHPDEDANFLKMVE